jgi:ATP-dependent DNA ligase
MLDSVRALGLEGIVGKRKDCRYESGKRSGAWIKYRVNRGQELVIGGYLPGTHGLDSVIVGYYKGKELIYVGLREDKDPKSVVYRQRSSLHPSANDVSLAG